MARKKIVTADAIKEEIRKLKQVKRLQRGKIQVGERADGQPIYHWTKITKAKIANQLGVTPDYLTSLQSKSEDIKDALRYVGQPRGSITANGEDEPRPGTKAYLKKQHDRLVKENEKLSSRLSSCRKGNESLVKDATQADELLENNEKLQKNNKKKDQKITRLESELRRAKMECASLKSQLILKGKC